MKELAPLLARDIYRAVLDAPVLTWFGALAGYACASLGQMTAYGITLVTWPLSFLFGVATLAMTRSALSYNARTRTFLPLCVLATTLGALCSGWRMPVTVAAALAIFAVGRALFLRRLSAASSVTALSAFISLWAFSAEVPHIGISTPTPLDLILPTYAWFALLLVAYPSNSTRGNRRLFGLSGLLIAGFVAYTLKTTPLYQDAAKPLATAAVLLMVVGAVVNAWSAFQPAAPRPSSSAYR